MENQTNDLVGLTADIVTAFVANNQIEAGEIATLITAVHAALAGVGATVEPEEAISKPTATQVRRSIHTAGLVSFLDGKPYKTLRRHLARHGFTPETYRETFGLPTDYPMVAADYAARRSEIAKAAGLGGGGRKRAAPKAAKARGRT